MRLLSKAVVIRRLVSLSHDVLNTTTTTRTEHRKKNVNNNGQQVVALFPSLHLICM